MSSEYFIVNTTKDKDVIESDYTLPSSYLPLGKSRKLELDEDQFKELGKAVQLMERITSYHKSIYSQGIEVGELETKFNLK